MKKKIFFVFCFFTLFSFYASAKQNETPKDFSVTYHFLSGGPMTTSTSEKYTIQGYQIIYEREYIPTEVNQNQSKKRKETDSYPLTAEQLNELWNLFLSYRFLDWPPAQAKVPALAGNQILTVKSDGKTVSHSMWESENEEKFRDFTNLFLKWVKKKMATEF